MSLEDVAELISPKKPVKIVRLLECFRSGRKPTIQDLMDASQESEKMVRYYLTKMREYYLIESFQDPKGQTRYSLNPMAFKARVESQWVDPLKRLASE
ncbi:hypothetical protein AKJ42_01785 [candidate division MSBL1 archaeon SCGC-AAA261C02]|uniref:HTH arsR-type domain-containing protein n=2 Tax=candidate division MSBL1 TaxID=215777 RepID=A0A133V104_9EURY|nr:hypothetical protein AKJ42_01785 [candidate division MSBL1 archaeon SCGC-AAA261C02]KXB09029.1 hypothetical protein AKJ46_01050 [candidate division MSBL1 archaeon SCGC-AAA833K04]